MASLLNSLHDPGLSVRPSDLGTGGAETDAVLRLVRLAARCLDAPAAILWRGDAAEPHPWQSFGLPSSLTAEPELPLAGGLCARVLAGGEPLAVCCVRDDLAARRDLAGAGFEALSFLGAPLPPVGPAQGVLAVLGREPREWAPAEVEIVRELAAAVANELERARLDAESESLAEALWRSEARYYRLSEAAMSAIFVVDTKGVLTEVNSVAAEILGRPASELLGQQFIDFIAVEDMESAGESFRLRLTGEKQRMVTELHVVRPSGERRLLTSCSLPICEGEEVVGVHGVARDVTEERARESQLRRAERMASVGPMLSGVCHELNNPLTSIKSFAELMLLDDRPTEDREALEIVQREAHRAAKIVSDLRVVARQSQEAGTGRGMVPLEEVVRDVLKRRRSSLDTHQITIRPELPTGLPAAWAVRAQLEEIVVQLVANAEHAVAQTERREIYIRTYRSGSGISLQVEDTGSGIPDADLDHIFDPFWTTKTAGEGSGLGLSLVQSIVADHGGRIQVDSKVGRGTLFTVELPAAEQPPVALGTTELSSASTRPLRILVVDDEAPIRYSLTRYMERRGHEVVAAAEGGEALRLLDEAAEDPFDIILADLRMPGLGGEEFFERLVARGDGLERRLIFITGDAESDDAERFLDAAGVPVVLKPFELAEIAQIIEVQADMESMAP